MRYFAKIKYLGTNFCGFQVQPDKRTVQGELCRALSEALGCDVKVTGCSRTDSGVHANEFCTLVDAPGSTVPADKLPVAVARFLPTDLSLYYAEEARDGFHPRYNVISKEYLYRIVNTRVYNPFDYGRAWFIPKPISDADVERMREAAEYIVGKKDFSTFMSEGSDIIDTVRTIFYLKIDKIGDVVEIKISADGFLYNMVRIIVGTLIDVAQGRTRPDNIPSIINSHDRSRAGMTAPAEGLYLNRVFY